MNISLIGMMGSGKTTIGKLLQNKLFEYSFVDTDLEIIKLEKKSINDIFAENGEAYFRKIETFVLKTILTKDSQIISTGGGVVINNENVELLKSNSIVFYLKASPDVLFERVKNNNERPLLNVDDMYVKIKSLLKQRSCNYEKAHYIIETDKKSPENILREIAGIINDNCKCKN